MKLPASFGWYGAAVVAGIVATAIAFAIGDATILLGCIILAGLGGRRRVVAGTTIASIALATSVMILEPRHVAMTQASGSLGAFALIAVGLGFVFCRRGSTSRALQEEHDSRRIVDSIPGLAWSADAEGNIRFCNQAVFEYTGWRRGEDAGFAGQAVMHPDEAAAVIERWRGSLRSGEDYESEHRLRRHDGTWRWFRAVAKPERNAAGEIIAWYGCTLDIDDSKRAEEILRSSEESMRSIVESIPGMIGAADAEGNSLFANERLRKYVGLKPFEKFHWVEIVHPDDRDEAVAIRQNAMVTGQPYETAFRRRRHDGVYRWCRVRLEPVRDKTGNIVRWYSLVVDVHEEKLAEDALAAREQRLQEILDGIPGMIFALDGDGSRFYANRRLLKNSGIAHDRTASYEFAEIVHEDDLETMVATRTQGIATGQAYELVYRRRRIKGDFRWCRVRVEPARDANGRIVRWYGLAVDVHEQRLATEALRRSEQQLRLLIDTIPSLVWCGAPDGTAVYINRQLLDYAGLTAEELSSAQSWLIHPDDQEIQATEWALAIEEGRPFSAVYRVRRADGTYRWHEARASALQDASGAIVQWYGVNVDIDDRVRAEQALRQTQAKLQQAAQLASLAELSASIAHEINQPLAAIAVNCDACQRWLSADPPNIERARATAGRIVRDIKATAEVVSRVRALFRQEPESKGPVVLADVVGEVCELLADDIQARSASIEIKLPEDLPRVRADRVQIMQVLLNLIRNGIESMEAIDRRRSLEISAYAGSDRSVVLEIRDHGTGVVDTDTIFEPFYTTKSGGMGLGLAISRSIVEAHDGKLWAKAASPQGTIFTLLLPSLVPDRSAV